MEFKEQALVASGRLHCIYIGVDFRDEVWDEAWGA